MRPSGFMLCSAAIVTALVFLACGDATPGETATPRASVPSASDVSTTPSVGTPTHPSASESSASATGSSPPQPSGVPAAQPSSRGGDVRWFFDGTAWRASGSPPACPTPLVLRPPVGLADATSVLYPGQVRGGHYKAHGGFRFDSQSTNAVDVAAPIAGTLVEGARYIEGGEVQYLVDLIAPCGIMVRFDHLRVLASEVEALFASFPPPSEGDSRTSAFGRFLAVSPGQRIATGVGFVSGPNVSVDFGVYDLRQRNAVSRDAAWLAQHGDSQAPYAVCWLDWLGGDSPTVRGLPAADAAAGTQSDYCR